MISGLVNLVVVHHSWFEVDLNRAKDAAIYFEPAQAWGLNVWKERPPENVILQSLNFHDDYYSTLKHLFSRLQHRYGVFILLDVHSYNHRRDGADCEPAMQQASAGLLNNRLLPRL